MFISKAYRQAAVLHSRRQYSAILKAFATIDPDNMGAHSKGQNLVNGEWKSTAATKEIIDPLTGKVMLIQPDTSIAESQDFINQLAACPKSGLHNPFRNKERYLMLGEVS